MLARFAPIIAGPELNVAGRPELFREDTYRAALLAGLMHVKPVAETIELSNGRTFHTIPPMLLTHPDSYGFDSSFQEKADLIAKTSNWFELVCRIRDRLVDKDGIPANAILIEHSPSCSVSLLIALEVFPRMRAIHLVRDPRDAVASMMERRTRAGFFSGITNNENMRLTVAQWGVLMAAALKAERHPGYLRISYEDLVTQTEPTLRRIIDHLGETEDGREKWDGGKRLSSKLASQPGWRNTPSGRVSTDSIGRYRTDFDTRQLDALTNLSFASPLLAVEGTMSELIARFAYEGSDEPSAAANTVAAVHRS
jgi:hypothetical protein